MSTLSLDQATEHQLLTAEEFLDWLEPKVYADLISGEKFMHSPVNLRHGALLNFVHGLLMLYCEERKLGRVHRENIAVRFGPRDVFMPDLCYFTNEQVARLPENYATFAPTLVVEALSPSTAQRDVGVKFAAYERYGVQEYWILDPQTQAHRFYARESETLAEFARGEALIASRAISGLCLPRTWLDPVNPPPVLPSLREVLGTS